jgi:hypothetical protein
MDNNSQKAANYAKKTKNFLTQSRKAAEKNEKHAYAEKNLPSLREKIFQPSAGVT